MSRILLLTGPPASGKNTIAHCYATRYRKRCAVIDGDMVRWMLRQPHRAPWEGQAGRDQHRLGVRNSCLLANSFFQEGFEVLILDVVDDSLITLYRELLHDFPLRVIRLLPSWDVALLRMRQRAPTLTEAEARMLYDQQTMIKNCDYSLDNSAVAVEDAARWLTRLE